MIRKLYHGPRSDDKCLLVVPVFLSGRTTTLDLITCIHHTLRISGLIKCEPKLTYFI